MRGFGPVAGLLLALSGSALATGSDRDPAKAAQDVALARLAPTVCDDVRTDAEAVRSFMDRAGVGEADLTGRYAAAIRIAVRRFRDAAD